MARKKRKPKIKVGISIDPDLWDSVVELADLRERGGVSGVVIDCIRRSLIPLKESEAPDLVSRLESLEHQLRELEWKRYRDVVQGSYTPGDYRDEMAFLEAEIAEEKREIAIEKQIEEHRSKRELS